MPLDIKQQLGALKRKVGAHQRRSLLPESLRCSRHCQAVWKVLAGLGWKLMPLPPEQAAEAALLLAIPILVPCQESSRSQAGTMWLFKSQAGEAAITIIFLANCLQSPYICDAENMCPMPCF